jgi:PAS domain S-box-containing protein
MMIKTFRKQKVYLLIVILTITLLIITISSSLIIYHKADDTLQTTLKDIVEREISNINVLSEKNHSEKDILGIIFETNKNLSRLNISAEIIISQKIGDSLNILIDLKKDSIRKNFLVYYKADNILPLYHIFEGKAILIKGHDHFGNKVYAYGDYFPKFGWSVIAKTSVTDFRKPYYYSGIIIFIVALLLITLAAILFIRITSPLEAELEKKKAELEHYFNSSPDLLCISDTKGYFLKLNPVWEKTLGYSIKELEGRQYLDFVHPDDRELTIRSTRDLDMQKSETNFINRYSTKDGQYRWLEWNSRPEGKIVYAAARDITHKIEIQNKLKESEHKFYNLFNSMAEGGALLDLVYDTQNDPVDYKFLDINSALEKLIGLSGEKIRGKLSTEIFKTENPPFFEIYLNTIRTGESTSFETYFEPLKKHFRISVFSPSPGYFASVFFDISDNKAYQEQLKMQNDEYLALNEMLTELNKDYRISKEKAEESETYLFAIIENQPGLVWLKDANGRFQKVNSKFLNACGVSDISMLIGKTDFDIWPQELAEKYVKDDQKVMNSGKSYITEEVILDKDKYLWFETFKTPVFNENGKVIGTTGYSFDISERKTAEQELINAKEKAEESDKLKTAFLQNMSHEIRTPLNAICGFSDMLAEPEFSKEKIINFVSIIQNSSKQLLSIVSNILTISTLETKQEKVNISNVCINNILIELLEIFNQPAKDHNVLLYTYKDLNDNQSEIFTDQTKITQILSNLITNAIKFTSEGHIEFGYRLVKEEESNEAVDNTFLEFYVKDTGLGINPEMHEKIFERFRQADLSINKNYGGTGLGLSISKGFVELLGGKIWIDSTPGKGSTFFFTIPYTPVNRKEDKTSDTINNLRLQTVLIAEDEEYNYLYLEELLRKNELKLIHAKDGKQTVDICRDNPEIDIILMDIKMPVMDGYEAAKMIRTFRPELPIIAQTAYALVHEIEKYKGIFDDYIPKPVEKEKFWITMSKYISNTSNSAPN